MNTEVAKEHVLDVREKPRSEIYGLTRKDVIFFKNPKAPKIVRGVSWAIYICIALFLIFRFGSWGWGNIIGYLFLGCYVGGFWYVLFDKGIGEFYAHNLKCWPWFQQYQKDLARWETTQYDYWQSLSSGAFESAVASYFRTQGYNATVIGGPNDKGIDVIAKKPDERVLIQCKKYSKQIGPNHVREFIGAIQNEYKTGAYIFALNGFSKAAILIAKEGSINLQSIRSIIKPDDFKGF